MNRNKYIRLVCDMGVFALGTVFAKLVQFLLMPIYTTYMTTEAYGMAELTNNLSEFFFPIVTICIYEAVFRYAVDIKIDKKEVISFGMMILTGSAFLVGGGLVILQKFVHYKYMMYLYFILYAYSFRMLIAYYVRGKGFSKVFAVSGVVNAICLACFSFVFLVLLDMGVRGYLLAIGIAYLISMIFLFVGGKVYEDLIWKIRIGRTGMEMLKYSMPLIVYNIGYWLTMMSGRYIILWSKGASEAGLYAAVVKLAAVINMMQQAFFAAFQLNTSREYESVDREQYYTKIFRLYSGCILVFGSLILGCSPLLAKLTLRKEFFTARQYLPVVLFIAVIDCMFCFYKTMYTTFKLTKRAVPSMLLGAGINVFVGILTVNKYGIWGIFLASLLCNVFQIAYRVLDVKRFIDIKCNWFYLVPCCTLSGIQAFLLADGSGIHLCFSWVISVVIIAISMFEYRGEVKELLALKKKR